VKEDVLLPESLIPDWYWRSAVFFPIKNPPLFKS
jgi:hypothetical protein